MNENKMKAVAAKLMKKLKDIDLDKVSAITIGIQMSGPKPDKMCPKCGKPMSECGCDEKEKEDYDD